MKEIELVNLRKNREKHFLQENGNIVVRVYDDNIHFKKNGVYEEINNNLIKKNEYYTNISNEYKVFFNSNVSSDLMRIEKDEQFINFKLLNFDKFLVSKENSSSKLVDTLCYKNILDGIDLEYKIMPTKIKESIIIKENKHQLEKLEFLINTNLELINQEGKIICKKNNKIVFSFDKPYMIDSNDNFNNNISYILLNEGGKYKLKLVADEKWLEKATYPVVIDPTITNYGENNSVYDTYIYPGDTNVDRNSQDFLKVGVENSGSQSTINRALIKFDLPKIGTGSQIISAYLTLIGYPLTVSSYESDIVNVHRMTEDWNETTANWNNCNNKFDSKVEASFGSMRSYIDPLGNLTPRYSGGEITGLVKKWYSDTPNYGILLKLNKEMYRSDVLPMFYSKDNAVVGTNPKPILVIEYRNQNGLEDYLNYCSHDFVIGKTYLNSYNGNLIGVFKLGNTIGTNQATILKLVYNTNDVVLENDLGFGYGYMLNFNQMIKPFDPIDGINYLQYIDEDGTIHYLKEINNVFKDEDGLGLTLETSNNTYILLDKLGNKKIFNIVNNIGYLSRIEYNNGKTIDITYNNQGLISNIVDELSQEITIDYQGSTIVIVSPEGTTQLSLSSGKIIQIATLTGNTIFQYNNKGLISNITDETGKKIVYEYYDEIPYRAMRISEYGLNNTLGKYYDIEYGFNATKISDNSQKSYTMTFNNIGNLISYSNLNDINNIKDAYGNCLKYGETMDFYNEINVLKNKLMNVDIPNRYVKNFLGNSSFENNTFDFQLDQGITISQTNQFSEYGLYSLLIAASIANSAIQKSISVPKNEYYTFSVFIKNLSSVKISLGYYNQNNEYIEKISPIITSNSDFERNDITIFYSNEAISDLIIKIYMMEIGSAFIDAMQLEKGQVANNYNMLENSDFSNNFDGWTLSAEDGETFDPLNVNDYFSIQNINTNLDKALRVAMDPSVRTGFSKRFYVNGKLGDSYTISFWYKNEGFPTTGQVGDTTNNDMLIFFNYVDQSSGHGIHGFTFNPNDNCWQFFSQTFVAEQDFDYLELRFYQANNANSFYVTNMGLFRDIRSINYAYDTKGNIEFSQGYNDGLTEFKYDNNNQIIGLINPKGEHFSYEYDNIDKNKLISYSSDLGISTKIKYDEFGNRIMSKTQKIIDDELNNSMYKIRMAGTNKYLRNIENILNFAEDDCAHDLWILESQNDMFRIKYNIIHGKYLSVNNQKIILSDVANSALFDISKNFDGSYSIRVNSIDKYVKFENGELILGNYQDDDNKFKFFFETTDKKLFIENNAEYSNDGRFLVSTTDSSLNKTSFETDTTTGLISSKTDANGNKTDYTYNSKKQLILVESGERQLNYQYNLQNLISNIIKGNKNYIFTYDDFLNRKSIKIGQNVNLVTNAYTNDGSKLVSSTYGNGDIISYEYDNYDRVNKKIKMDKTYNNIYDNSGNIVKIVTNDGETKYIYDFSKRLRSYLYDNFKLDYTYDSDNNIVKTAYKLDNLTEVVNYDYNDDSITQISFDNEIIEYQYDELGRLTNSTINNNYNKEYSYESKGNRTSYLIKSLRNNDDEYSYDYDNVGNIIRIYHNGILENRYFYNQYNELICEKNYVTNRKIEYKYDTEGNLLNETTYDLKNYNQLSINEYKYENQYWEDLLTEHNGNQIIYDGIGNPTQIGTDIELEWINARELKKYTDLNNVINYKYNVDGIRTSKTINNVETKYYLEGNRIIFEECNGSVLYYIYDDVNDVIGFKYNNDLYYYIKNLQKDIIGIMDSNNMIIAKYSYDSWGKVTGVTDGSGNSISASENHIANKNPIRYRSYYYDAETGLYYLNNRYYNPEWRRFINPDPIIGSSNDISCYNLFAYVHNNPIINIDPNGLGLFKKAWDALYNFGRKISKPVVNIINAVKNAFVFDVGVGVGLDGTADAILGGSVGYYKDTTFKIENGEAKKGSTTSSSLKVSGVGKDLGLDYTQFHEYHDVPGDIDKTINHTNPLPFMMQVNDCDHTETSTTVFLETKHSGKADANDEGIFLGLDFSLHVGVGGHIRLGFNITW